MLLRKSVVRLGGEWVITVRANTRSAVDSTPTGIALARLALLSIPKTVPVLALHYSFIDQISILLKETSYRGFVSPLLSGFTNAMARARIRACKTPARITFISIIARALSGTTITYTGITTLSVVVGVIISVRNVIPCNRVGALALRTICAHPCAVTRAPLVSAAYAMP